MRHAAPKKPRAAASRKKNGFPTAIAFAGVGVLALCTVILFVMLIRFGAVPSTWLIVGGCVAALLIVLLAAGCDSRHKAARIVCFVLALVISLALIFGIVYLRKAMSTLQNIYDDGSTVTRRVSVVVLEDDPARELEDTAGYGFGIMGIIDRVSTDGALSLLEQRIGSVSAMEYSSMITLANGLLDGSVQAILINEGYLPVVRENVEEFDSATRVLETFTLEQTVSHVSDDSSPDNIDESLFHGSITDDNDYDSFIVYLTGIDTYGAISSVSRSDVNILAVVNPETKQILLVTTPRDAYVPLPLCYDNYDKLTHAGLYGVESSMVTLAQFYDVSIPYYVRVNFTGFSDIVDAIGGIEVYSEKSFSSMGYDFEAGANYMDGEAALAFVRARYAFVDGDFQRGRNQMAAVRGIVNRILSPAILSSYMDLMDSIAGSFTTNLTEEQISGLVKMQLQDNASWNVVSYEVTGYVDWCYCYNLGDYGSVVILDGDSVREAQDLIRAVFAGEILQ